MTTIAQESRSLQIAGSELSFLDRGEGSAVLLGHSFLWDAEMWRPQVDALSRRYRVVVPELWGHGASGALPAGTRDLRDIARHHLSLMDRLGIERFAVVGLSVGGMWGAELALMAPDRVSALILLDSFVGPEPEVTRHRYFEMLRMIEAAQTVPEPILDAVVPLFFASDVEARRPDLPRGLRARLRGWPGDRLVDSVAPLGRIVFGRRDMMGEIGALRMPRLVMCGRDDVARPISEAMEMAEALGCACLAIPRAGHISSLEAPEVVTREIADFLDGLPG